MENTNIINTNMSETIMGVANTPMPDTNAQIAQETQSTAITQLTPEQIAMLQRMRPKTKVREYKKVHRNDTCPCGSGLKYKKCCLASGKYEALVNKN